MSSAKTKNSNHELMRIISMFFIVLWHVIINITLRGVNNSFTLLFYNLMLFLICIHVNSYVLLTGYYQSKTTFKQSNLWRIINSSWFYRVVIVCIFLLFSWTSISKTQLLKELAPIGIDNYWFLKNYLILYCLSPFLNRFIKSLDKKAYRILLLVCFIIFSIIPASTGGEFFSNDGYSLYNFIYLYFIGAYLRIYPPEKDFLFKKFKIKKFIKIMVFIFFTCALANTLIYYIGIKIGALNGPLSLISEYIKYSALNYSNPLIIIQSIAYFSIFTAITFRSKVINKISVLMLGIYFIHENNYIRENLYQVIGMGSINRSNLSFIPYAILVAVLIFIVCGIIEFIRQKIFLFIYNRNISKKIRDKYYKTIHKISDKCEKYFK